MMFELYPASTYDAYQGMSIQYSREIDEAIQQILDACKGIGTDEQTLIEVLGSMSLETRNLILLRYKELHQQPLNALYKSEISGGFGRLLCMISTPLPETEAQILRDAAQGMGTTESLIIQILAGRTNEEMNILKRSYFNLMGKDLAVVLDSELSGDYREVIMAVLQSSRVPYNLAIHNAAKAEKEAVELYKAGQGRLGTDEEAFIDILVKAPPEFLKLIDAVYVAKYKNNIVKAVEKEFSGDAKKSLKYFICFTLDPYPTIAELFEKTMNGFETDEMGLSTTLVRFQSVLPYVKAAFKRRYSEELRDRISRKTSGDYRKLLLKVFDAPRDPLGSKMTDSSGVDLYIEESVAYTGARQNQLSQRSTAPTLSARHESSAPAYPVPTGQHSHSLSFQTASAQAPNGPITSSTDLGGNLPQTSNSHHVVYSSKDGYSGQSADHKQTPIFPASSPAYPVPTGQHTHGLPSQAASAQAPNGLILSQTSSTHVSENLSQTSNSQQVVSSSNSSYSGRSADRKQIPNIPASGHSSLLQPYASARHESGAPAYPVPAGQHAHGLPSQADSAQASNRSIPSRTSSTHFGENSSQTSNSHHVVNSSKNDYSGQSADHKQTPNFPASAPAYPVPTGQYTHGLPSQAVSGQAPNGSILLQTSSTHVGENLLLTSNSHQAVSSSNNSYSGQSADHKQTPNFPASGHSSLLQPNSLPGQQFPVQQYQQHPLPGQQPQIMPYQQFSPHYQQHLQLPPDQTYQQYPTSGGQSQYYRHYSVPELHLPGQSYHQYPVSGLQPVGQPYQQYAVPGQQHPLSEPYQQPYYPTSQYQQHGGSAVHLQQNLGQSHQQFTPHGQQTSTHSQQQYTGYGQQQYPVPQQSAQPYQKHNGQPEQLGYPSIYAAAPTLQHHSGHPPPY
ncbi:putative annexin [Plasmopara halstedii]